MLLSCTTQVIQKKKKDQSLVDPEKKVAPGKVVQGVSLESAQSKPIKSGQTETWRCVKCTYINQQRDTECTVCREGRNSKDEYPSLQAAAEINAREDKKTWICSACTFENVFLQQKKKFTKCEMCEAHYDPKQKKLQKEKEEDFDDIFPPRTEEEKEIFKQKILEQQNSHRLNLESDDDSVKEQAQNPNRSVSVSDSDSSDSSGFSKYLARVQKVQNNPIQGQRPARISQEDWQEKKKEVATQNWRCPICWFKNPPNRQICKKCNSRTIHLYRLQVRHGLTDSNNPKKKTKSLELMGWSLEAFLQLN